MKGWRSGMLTQLTTPMAKTTKEHFFNFVFYICKHILCRKYHIYQLISKISLKIITKFILSVCWNQPSAISVHHLRFLSRKDLRSNATHHITSSLRNFHNIKTLFRHPLQCEYKLILLPFWYKNHAIWLVV